MRSKVAERILAETPEDVKIYVRWYADIVVRVNQFLKEKNLTQKEFAEKMDKKPSEISKWLSGDHNFTMRSLAKLQAEIGEPLVIIAKRPSFEVSESHKKSFSISSRSVIVKQGISFQNWEKEIDSTDQQLANVG